MKLESMANEAGYAKRKIQELASPVKKHIALLFCLAPNRDSHHWLNNGVLAPLEQIFEFSFLKKGARVKKDWLYEHLYFGYFGEPHSFKGNVLTALNSKSEYTSAVTEANIAQVYPVLDELLRKTYEALIREVLATSFDAQRVAGILLTAVQEFHSYLNKE